MDNPNLYNSPNVARNIKERAKACNVSIKDMLTDLGLGINTLSSMNHGKAIAFDSLARIADYLDCSVDYLLGKNYEIKKTPIGERIAEIRKEKGLSQADLGRRISMSESKVLSIENGTILPTISLAQSIAYALGVSMFELVVYDDYCLKEEERQEYATLYHAHQDDLTQLSNIEYSILIEKGGFSCSVDEFRSVAESTRIAYAPTLYDERFFTPEHIAFLASKLSPEEREAVVCFINQLITPRRRTIRIRDI